MARRRPAKGPRYQVSDRGRNKFRNELRQGVSAAFSATQAKVRAAVMASEPGAYFAESLWDPEWWETSVDRHVAPVLWRIHWEAAYRAADATGGLPMGAALGIETRWRRQVTNLYSYGDSVGRRIAVLSEQGEGETRGWMLDKLGLVAAAGPMSAGIEDGMVTTEALEAENAGTQEGVGSQGTKTWIALGVNTRPSHEDADGQTVGADEMFEVGGEEAEYPGDENLSPEERINCNCSVEYATEVEDDDPFAMWAEWSEDSQATLVDDAESGMYDTVPGSDGLDILGDGLLAGVFSAVMDTPEFSFLSGLASSVLDGGLTFGGVSIPGTLAVTALLSLMSPGNIFGRADTQFQDAEDLELELSDDEIDWLTADDSLLGGPWSEQSFRGVRRAMRGAYRKADGD